MAQDFSNLWEGYFSYLNIKDVTKGNNKIYAAAENAVFIYDEISEEVETKTTVNGLSGETISTIYYSETYEILLVGYETGLIKVYLENEDDVLTVVDIVEKQNIPPDSKRINHFNELNDIVYISTDYGISVYDLQRLEFGDTYYIGNGGTQTNISQTTILNDEIFASSLTTNGVKSADVNNENLIDFSEWSQFITGDSYSAIQSIENKLYATRNNIMYDTTLGMLVQVSLYGTNVVDVKEVENNLVVTTDDFVGIYDANFNLILGINPIADYPTNFTSATISGDNIYIGTEGFGLLKTSFSSPVNFSVVYSDGPLKNNAFSIEAGFNKLYLSYGDYTPSYNPSPNRRYGLSYLQDEVWNNISYDSIRNTVGQDVFNLNAISINPNNPSQAFISSFQHGILVLDEDGVSTLLNEDNSGLESLVLPTNPSFKSIRVSGSIFDNQGLLWSLTARVDRPLKAFNPSTNQWQSFSFTSVIEDGLTDEFGFSDVVISDDGTKWIGSRKSGVIGFNESGNRIKNIFDETLHNFPDRITTALAIDNRNQLWIGTIKGLRVLYNTGGFFEDDTVSTFPIIILEDGIPKELLEQQYITDIKVDGSNNKWVGTLGAGIFYFSYDGQETIYHFTKDNSPLPSNNINDISIDSSNGKVYIATDKGLVSFGAGGSKPQESLTEAYVYPNPVRPGFDMFNEKIKIKDISENCNIKITDIEGNLVAEAQSGTNSRYRGYNLEIDGGTAYWNGRNLANNTVASGVYLVMLSDLDNFETKVLKLMVVR